MKGEMKKRKQRAKEGNLEDKRQENNTEEQGRKEEGGKDRDKCGRMDKRRN